MKYIKYLLLFSFLQLISFSIKAVDIPAEDDILVSDWGSSLVLDTDQTIKIVNITHNGGRRHLLFEIEHFSPYALVLLNNNNVPSLASVPSISVPNTSDNIIVYIIMSFISIIGIIFISKYCIKNTSN